MWRDKSFGKLTVLGTCEQGSHKNMYIQSTLLKRLRFIKQYTKAYQPGNQECSLNFVTTTHKILIIWMTMFWKLYEWRPRKLEIEKLLSTKTRFEQRTQMWLPGLNRGSRCGSQVWTEDPGVSPRFEQRTQVWVPGSNRGPKCGYQVWTEDSSVGPRFEQRTQVWVPGLNRGPRCGSRIWTEDLSVGLRFEQRTQVWVLGLNRSFISTRQCNCYICA